MEKRGKPTKGCDYAGFTFVDADGELIRCSWDELHRRGEGLFCFDGTHWRRLRRAADASRYGEGLRFAVAPLDAARDDLERQAVSLPASLLTGEFTDRIARLRRLAAMPRLLLDESNLASELSPGDLELVHMLQRSESTGISDRALVDRLTASSSAADDDIVIAGTGGLRAPRTLVESVGADALADLARAVAARSASSTAQLMTSAFADSCALLVKFLDREEPVTALLTSLYGLPEGPRWQTVNACRLLDSFTVSSAVAAAFAAELGPAASDETLRLAVTTLRRSGGDLDITRSALEEHRADPESAIVRFGDAGTLLARRLPELDEEQRLTMLSAAGVHPASPVDVDTLRCLDMFDPDTVHRLRELLSDEEFPLLAPRLLATFSTRAPDWLLKSSSSPVIDRARLLARLPDANTAVRRVAQLEELLTAEPLSPGERAQHRLRAATLSDLAGGELTWEQALGDDALAGTLVMLLPDASLVRKRIKQLTGAPGQEERVQLLTAFDAARTGGDAAECERLALLLLADTELRGQLLGNEKAWSREAERSRQLAAGDEDARRRESLESEFALWKSYADAFVTGDEDELFRVGALLRPDREATLRVSPHDASFWLPSRPSEAESPDGNTFGQWLLSEDRGLSALRTETGRRSLGAAAQQWPISGTRDASIKQLVDEVATARFGGFHDPVTVFFAENKVGLGSASRTVELLRATTEVPSAFPLDSLFVDEGSGFRGYFLPRTDPRGMQLGVLTDCCQHPDGAGSSCARMGQEHPSGGFFVVEDAEGRVLAQSWVWAGSTSDGSASGAVFDNIEARLSGASPERSAAVRSVYEQAADELARRFQCVTVGATSDIAVADLPLLDPHETLNPATVGYQGYVDSRNQRLWRRSTPDTVVTGRADGFEVRRGDSSAVISADGTVTVSDATGVELARELLATSTFRDYEFFDVSGERAAPSFRPASGISHGWQPDLSAVPDSYDKVSEDLLTAFDPDGRYTLEEASAWLRLAAMNPLKAQRYAASGWGLEEAAHSGGRPLPPQLAHLEPSSPERRTYLALHRQSPEIAEAYLSDPSVAEAFHVSPWPTGRIVEGPSPAAFKAIRALDGDPSASAVLDVFSPSRPRAGDDPFTRAVAEKTTQTIWEHSLTAIAATRELHAAGLSTEETATLLAFTDLDQFESTPSLLVDSDRALWASLTSEKRSAVRRHLQAATENGRLLGTHSLHGWVALPNDIEPYKVDVCCRVDGVDPYRVHVAATAVLAERNAGGGPVDDAHDRHGGMPDELREYRAAVDAVAKTLRYVRDSSKSTLDSETLAALTRCDIDEVLTALAETGHSHNNGHNMPAFTFRPEELQPLAAAPIDGPGSIRDLADHVSLHANPFGTASLTARILGSGLSGSDLAPLTSSTGQREHIDGRLLADALDRGVTADELRDLAASGVSRKLFLTLLASPQARALYDDFGYRADLEVVAAWAGTSDWSLGEGSPTQHPAAIDLAVQALRTSEKDREAVLALLTDPTEDYVTGRSLLNALPFVQPLLTAVGGLRRNPFEWSGL